MFIISVLEQKINRKTKITYIEFIEDIWRCVTEKLHHTFKDRVRYKNVKFLAIYWVHDMFNHELFFPFILQNILT